jgi:hypothetical protein
LTVATVQVRLPRMLAPFAGERRGFSVEGGTVQEVLAEAFGQYPLLRPQLYDERGALRQHVSVFVNDTELRRLPASAPVQDGDTIVVLQAMSGG